MKLISPSIEYEESYIEMVNDFLRNDEELVPFTLNEDYKDFSGLVQRLEGYSYGEGLPENFIEHKSFWLIDTASRVVGSSNMRLRLNTSLKEIGGHIGFGVMPSERGKGYATQILDETLIHAKNIGIEKALLTCNKANSASSRVIKKNGGVFHSEGRVSGHEGIIQRYWIEL